MRFFIGLMAILVGASADECHDFCVRNLNSVACGFGSYCKNEHACHNLFWTSAAKESICIRGTAGCVDTHFVSCAEARSGLVTTAALTTTWAPAENLSDSLPERFHPERREPEASGAPPDPPAVGESVEPPIRGESADSPVVRETTASTTPTMTRGILEAVVQVPVDEDGSVRPVRVYGSVFDRVTRQGNFAAMITQSAYANTLFVFNDNQPEYEAFRDRRGGCSPGGNNAAIRPFQCLPRPRAAGIPTGIAPPGYMNLDESTRRIIDEAVDRIRAVVLKHGYEEVVFSQHSLDDRTLGVGIFAPARPVRDYIVNRLLSLGLAA